MEDSEMENPSDFYTSRKTRFEDLCSEVKHSLEKELEAREIKYHSVTSRVKELDSFLEKIQRKGYSDPAKQAVDLAGIRVVCLFMRDLDRVSEAISGLFDVISKEDKVHDGDAETFGYMSHHYTCRLSGSLAGPRYDHIKDLQFEVQVRTILMDAWANISHYLAYKNEQSVPRGLVKDFAALSGLLYVADRQFENLFNASSMSAAQAQMEIVGSPTIPPSEINADTVHALLSREYSDRDRGNSTRTSVLTSEILDAGFRDIEEVAHLLRGVKGVAQDIELAEEMPGYDAFSFARFSLTLADERFRENFLKKTKSGKDEKSSQVYDEAIARLVRMARERGYEASARPEIS
ncbi:hypothetical protein AB0O57_06600 [Streptomyces sp. NPDC091201]|uniref:GTP pyrophosphokinase n=1 Tax=Streptomyces sp. NPDC091201 TaxID=3155190 RepID=UPI0034178292